MIKDFTKGLANALYKMNDILNTKYSIWFVTASRYFSQTPKPKTLSLI